MSRSRKRWLVVLGVLLLLVLGLRLGRNRICAAALHEVARQAEGSGYLIDFKGVNVSLVSGDISLSGLSMRPLKDPSPEDSIAWYTVSAEEVELLDVDLWSLMRDKRLRVQRVHIGSPEIEHSFVRRKKGSRKKAGATERPPGEPGLNLVQVDTLLIEGAKGSMLDRTKAAPSMTVDRLDILLCGIDVATDATGKPELGLGAARVTMHGLETHLEPYYTFRIDSMRVQMPHDSSVVFGVHMIPGVSAQDYHKQVEFQVELYELNIDTVMLAGFDLAAKLDDGILRAEHLYVSGAAFSIHRDKSIPLPPERKRKPLLSERIMHIPLPLALGAVELRRSSVVYHERLKRGEPYGSIAFTEISGLLTGLDNIDVEEDSEIHLDGRAALGPSKVHLDLHMPVFTDRTTLSATAHLDNLPAREINRMTDDLVHVNATAGRIHSVDIRMSGDDVSASGTVDIRYQDLHLEISPAMKHAGVLSFLANTVVRTSNMPGDKNYKVGHFKVKRRQEASVFNYLWLCAREGMLDVMLPPVVLEKMHRMQAAKKDG